MEKKIVFERERSGPKTECTWNPKVFNQIPAVLVETIESMFRVKSKTGTLNLTNMRSVLGCNLKIEISFSDFEDAFTKYSGDANG